MLFIQDVDTTDAFMHNLLLITINIFSRIEYLCYINLINLNDRKKWKCVSMTLQSRVVIVKILFSLLVVVEHLSGIHENC